MEDYQTMYKESIGSPEIFWDKQAKSLLHWFQPYDQVYAGDFAKGNVAWFLNGKINLSYNCLDRHIVQRRDQVALLWEGDEPDMVRKITYQEVLDETCRLANVLRSLGVQKGDKVAIYMGMVPEVAYAMLACARIGAVHSVVFAGFSPQALRSRIQDCDAKVLITQDIGLRGGKHIPLKKMADEALEACPTITSVLVHQRLASVSVPMKNGRDLDLATAMRQQRPYCVPAKLDAEDPLFLLYTSGSTGTPKGLLHTQAGYLLNCVFTLKYTFDVQEGDVFACMADVGWITGHSYIVYGPLALGTTSFMFESTPLYPNASRYWDMVERHGIHQLYTAPTAIRALMKYGKEPVEKHNRDSLRVLGTVGEPINPAAWEWYHHVVGNSQCSIVDTYFQTETGCHLLTPMPGATPTKPGSATFGSCGIEPVLLSAETGKIIEETEAEGILCIAKPWPSMARTVYGNHPRYLKTYFSDYPGYYFTGDGAKRDKDGYYWITGRVDDVINVSGHRLGTAEVESALVLHDACAEAAVIAVPHEVKGQSIIAYCITTLDATASAEERKKLGVELRNQVRKHIGPFASPDLMVLTNGLPKTRSGKIMRRILRKIVTQDDLGDVSTMADTSVLEGLQQAVKESQA